MNKAIDIQFNGLSTSPSDYACNDGDLAVCHNLVNEHGELRPVMPPGLAFNLPSGCKLLYIHRTQTAEMAVYGDGSDVYASTVSGLKDGDRASVNVASMPFSNIKSINSIGNILIIVDRNSDSHYYRFANGAYTYLGKGLPRLPRIVFGLHNIDNVSTASSMRKFTDEYPSIVKYRGQVFTDTSTTVRIGTDRTYMATANDEDMLSLFNGCMGVLSSMQNAAEKCDAFVNPFMVRYAFRLFDGTTSRLSAPVLMVPNASAPDVAVVSGTRIDDTSAKGYTVSPRGFLSYLRYSLEEAVSLSEWRDLIEGVDVFVSSPIYGYFPDLSLEDYKSWLAKHGTGLRPANICQHPSTGLPSLAKFYGAYDSVPTRGGYTPVLADGNVPSTAFCVVVEAMPSVSERGFNGRFVVPAKSAAELKTSILSVGTFYHVGTLPLEDLKDSISGDFKRVPIDTGALENLETREALKEDYLSNYEVKSSDVLVYNSRLIKSGSSRDIKTNFSLDTLTQYIFMSSPFGRPECYVKLEKGGVEYFVPLGMSSLPLGPSGNWLFYPDPDAKELVFVPGTSTDGLSYYSVPLTRHELLQGAYWMPESVDENFEYGGFVTHYVSAGEHIDEVSDLVPVKSSVYVSEVNNPFVFPSRLSATVGNGNVLALAATTLPISEGQQGQFPVMAFTDEGIWALSVSPEGSLSATNPMLRDVLVSPDSLCVIDDGVVYATKDGLRILRGKQSESVTEHLKDAFTGASCLPNAVQPLLHDSGGYAPPGSGKAQSWADGCRMVYASALKRLYVLPKGVNWANSTALVYSLTTGAWSSCAFRYKDPVEAYPTTYVQLSNKIYDVNVEDAFLPNTNAVVLTRPLTFGARNTPKTIMEAIVHGNFASRATPRMPDGTWKVKSDVNSVLYGSNNLTDWLAVGSSASNELRNRAGTPYKYFRLLVVAPLGLCQDKSITSATFDVQPRLNNTLR